MEIVPELVVLWDFAAKRLADSITGVPTALLWHKEPDVDSIGAIFRHAYERELFFYELIVQHSGGQVPDRVKPVRKATVVQLHAEAAEAHAALREELLWRSPEIWQHTFPFRGTWGEAHLTGEQIVWRLVLHTSYHTGQIHYARQLHDIEAPSNILEGI